MKGQPELGMVVVNENRRFVIFAIDRSNGGFVWVMPYYVYITSPLHTGISAENNEEYEKFKSRAFNKKYGIRFDDIKLW